jgi:O-succinylbenzoate synthase
MRLWFSLYTLEPRTTLSSRAGAGAREGALLKVETDHGVGYADLHPWPELGDEPIEAQLKKLETGQTTPLSERSLKLAALDAEARSKKTSAFAGLTIPASHFLITDITKVKPAALSELVRRGFTHVKVKLGRDLEVERQKWTELAVLAEARDFTWRFDLNGAASFAEVREFARRLSEELKEKIEFVEDPCRWNPGEWSRLRKETSLKFALDFALERSRFDDVDSDAGEVTALAKVATDVCDALVVKPAVQEPTPLASLARAKGWRLVVTSYLDHPVGQAGAALEAARLAAMEPELVAVCGLASHFAYHENEFSKMLRFAGACLLPPPGTGVGFDDLLNAQDWWELA